MGKRVERKALEDIKRLVKRFERKCNKAEYTDTGEVWEVFEDIEIMANDGLKSRRKHDARGV